MSLTGAVVSDQDSGRGAVRLFCTPAAAGLCLLFRFIGKTSRPPPQPRRSSTKGMLQPLAYTNHRLNSSIVNPSRSSRNEHKRINKPDKNSRRKSTKDKRVTFTKEGIPPSVICAFPSHFPLTSITTFVYQVLLTFYSVVSMLSLAMSKAVEDAKKAGNRTRDKTPQQVEKETTVIGSSSTWKQEELDHFNVTIKKDVDVRQMIPEKFFVFDHLEEYPQCYSYLIWTHGS
jgi:hypothetical protein